MTYAELMQKARWDRRPAVEEIRRGEVEIMAQWQGQDCRLRVTRSGWVLFEEMGVLTMYRMDRYAPVEYDVQLMDGENRGTHCISREDMDACPWQVTALLLGQERAWHNREARAARREFCPAERYAAETAPGPLEHMLEKEEKRRIRQYLASLPRREREALLLSCAAPGGKKALPETTLRRRRKKAAQHMRDLMAS